MSSSGSFWGRSVATLERALYARLQPIAEAREARHAEREGRQPKPQHLSIGERGEAEAYFYLRELGYTVVARRWRTPRLRGDIDLLAWDGDTLVVFEIKTRTARDSYAAEEQVDRDKRNQLRQQASAYLRNIPEPFREGVRVRFDVLAVYLVEGSVEFEHFADAFPRSVPPADREQRWN